MRSAVLAAAFAFHPRLAWARAPFTRLARTAGAAALRWLDARRARVDALQ